MECVMERRFHRGFTAAQKTELWDRWKRGESLKAIGRAFGKESSSIYFLVAPHGGIRPAQRRRSRLALTLAEREMISSGVVAPVDPTGDRRGHIRISCQPVSDLRRLKIGGARPFGRRSVVRAEQQRHRDLVRASYALRDVG